MNITVGLVGPIAVVEKHFLVETSIAGSLVTSGGYSYEREI